MRFSLLEEKNQTPRSPYIETLLGVLATKDHLAFATDCTDDLFELISRARLNPDSLRWSKRLQIAWQISHAMRYLHEELKVFHSDLRSGTIMLDEDSNVRVGAWMSQAFHSKVQWLNPQLLQRLPPVASKDKVAWKAPEIVQTHAFTQACNVYAFGTCCRSSTLFYSLSLV
jgi:serine/threonine protein kinase